MLKCGVHPGREELRTLDARSLIELAATYEDEMAELWASDEPGVIEAIATLMQKRADVVGALTGITDSAFLHRTPRRRAARQRASQIHVVRNG